MKWGEPFPLHHLVSTRCRHCLHTAEPSVQKYATLPLQPHCNCPQMKTGSAGPRSCWGLSLSFHRHFASTLPPQYCCQLQWRPSHHQPMVLMILSHRYQAFPEKIFVPSKNECLNLAIQNVYKTFCGYLYSRSIVAFCPWISLIWWRCSVEMIHGFK